MGSFQLGVRGPRGVLTARRMCPWSPSVTSEGEVKHTGGVQRETAVGHQRAVTWGLQNAPHHQVAWRTPKRCRSPAPPSPQRRGGPGVWTTRSVRQRLWDARDGLPSRQALRLPPAAGAMEQKRRWWIIYKPLAAPHGCLAESHHQSRPRRARPTLSQRATLRRGHPPPTPPCRY